MMILMMWFKYYNYFPIGVLTVHTFVPKLFSLGLTTARMELRCIVTNLPEILFTRIYLGEKCKCAVFYIYIYIYIII